MSLIFIFIIEASEDEEQPGHLLRKRLKCSDEAEDTVYSRAALLTTIVELDALEPDFSIIYIKIVFEFAIGFRVDETIGSNCQFLQFIDSRAKRRHQLVDHVVVSEIRRCLEEGLEL
ncbi:flavin-binding [Striga asiatica]|uniref:Flavin-binding n=1 Tax=Striga asiatica TaxID=4170 RepID=A0A5A7NUL6_STRAF|nr:flavin-binding [Striga asiatica]